MHINMKIELTTQQLKYYRKLIFGFFHAKFNSIPKN